MGNHGFLKTDRIFNTIDINAASTTFPLGVNDAGQIVGGFTDFIGTHGFLLNPDASLTTIDVSGAFETFAHGINNAGQIVGSYFDFHFRPHGFLRNSNGTITTFDSSDGSDFIEAQGVNNAGQIVGILGVHAFVHTGSDFTTGFTLIDIPPAAAGKFQGAIPNIGANGINDAGQIVGTFGNASDFHGFLATPLDWSGSDVSDLASIPEPSTWLLLGSGLAGLVLVAATRASAEPPQRARAIGQAGLLPKKLPDVLGNGITDC